MHDIVTIDHTLQEQHSNDNNTEPTDIINNPICHKGITTRNYVWPEICGIIDAGRLELLGRLQSQIDVYWSFRDQKLLKYNTLADDIIQNKFGTDIVYDEIANKYEAKLSDLNDINRIWPPLNRLNEHIYYQSIIRNNTINSLQRICIVYCPNDFGYALSPDISHYLIWSNVVLDNDTISIVIEQQLPYNIYHVKQFVNPPHLQSVKNLWHCHIFAKKRDKPLNDSNIANNNADTINITSDVAKNLVLCK